MIIGLVAFLCFWARSAYRHANVVSEMMQRTRYTCVEAGSISAGTKIDATNVTGKCLDVVPAIA